MAPWLTWAWSTAGEAPALKAAGIKTMLYTNPNRQAPGGPMYTSDEATFAHDCKAHRIQFPLHNDIYLMQPSSLHLENLWQAVAKANPQFDAYFDDTAGVVSNATSMPCNFNENTWMSEINALNNGFGRHIVYNGLGNLGANMSIAPSFLLNPSTMGGMLEGCYSAYDTRNPKPHTYVWQTHENTEIKMAAAGKLFICRGLNQQAAAQQISARLYLVASFLLTYDLSNSILNEKFTTRSNFDEEPESELVPAAALKTTPSTIAALRLSSGVYGREYNVCYLRGQSVGPCAVTVNSDLAAEKYPWGTKYRHTLVLSGGGIIDGGTVSTGGPAPPAFVGAMTGVISFQ